VSAQVLLIPSDYNPETADFKSTVIVDTVQSDGAYRFSVPKLGTYNVQAYWGNDGSRLWIPGIHPVKDSITDMGADTLSKPGVLKISLPDSFDKINGYLYIPGTTISAHLQNNGYIEFDSVPQGTFPVINYSSRGAAPQKNLRYSFTVVSGATTTLYNPSWIHSKRLFFNTRQSGAGVSANVFNFPALVRLTSANFNFSEAQPQGQDIRFAKDSAYLAYEIERWDAAAGLAEVWVKIDTVFGNDSSHFMTMYWGNPQAGPASNSAAVFDTGNGFQGVWHMNQAANVPIRDATYNNYTGTRFGQSATAAGTIGIAQAFDGSSTYVQMMGTAYGKMNFPKNGDYCVSAWVFADTLNLDYHIIASKGNTQYNLEIRKNNNWQFNEYKDYTGWEITNSPGTAKTWTHLAGVRSGNNQYLYVNGICVSNTPWMETNVFARYTGDDFKLGRRTDLAMYFFNGIIDEVRVSSIDLSADWIKLCFMNQRPDDKLIVFK
jgi:hypothetical protein